VFTDIGYCRNLRIMYVVVVKPCKPLFDVDEFEKAITDFVGAKYAIALSSGTAALYAELALAQEMRSLFCP
jgi:hypothetical protein